MAAKAPSGDAVIPQEKNIWVRLGLMCSIYVLVYMLGKFCGDYFAMGWLCCMLAGILTAFV